MQFKLEVITIGAAYFGYFVAAIVALGLLAQDDVPASVVEYAHQVVFVTSGPALWLHALRLHAAGLRGAPPSDPSGSFFTPTT